MRNRPMSSPRPLKALPPLSEGSTPLLETHTEDGELKPAHERLSDATYLLCSVSSVLTLLSEHAEDRHRESAHHYAEACQLLAKVSAIATGELLEIVLEKDGRE